ncbi:MAG: hypothetical protein KBD53_06985 [Candidatus Omnitrophica bacterium]|nr:hypothetical protein [Candidatus Omnitrophota bacterium]
MEIILEEMIKDEDGNTVGVKELVNEIIFNGRHPECITREVIKLHNGRVVIDQVLYRSEIKHNQLFD